jgi:hypothetical protein
MRAHDEGLEGDAVTVPSGQVRHHRKTGLSHDLARRREGIDTDRGKRVVGEGIEAILHLSTLPPFDERRDIEVFGGSSSTRMPRGTDAVQW